MSTTPSNIVLDWQPRTDERNLRYAVARQTKIDTRKALRNKQWTRHEWLNQGTYDCPECRQYGACTGYATAHAMETAPYRRDMTDEHAHAIYHRAKDMDEWTGSDYEGSSVLGAMQAIKEAGYIDAYWWCPSVSELAHAVSRYGPVVAGTYWHRDMWEPDSRGFIHPRGPIDGGHAYLIAGVNVDEETFRVDNSWGREWGEQGSALITFSEVDILMQRDAEFALPRKIKP